MSREIIHTDDAMKPFAGYSHAVKAAGLVFVSGQGPFDPAGNLIGESIQAQARQCLTNVSAILTAAGSAIEKVVSATIILAEEGDFVGMNEEWGKWFTTNPTARQGAKRPVRPQNMKISIAVIAEA